MRYVSLFSGIEAASVAWEPLGWEPAAFAEIEPFPCAVLAERFPSVPNLGDVTEIDWKEFIDGHGPVDLVVGGSPCQAFSVAGARKGLLDARGRLMFEYVRAVREIGPRWLLWENVPGVFSQDGGRAFESLLVALDDCGYSLSWRVLDAQFFGVAQRRRRVFLVGHLGADVGPAAAVLFDEGMRPGNSASSKTKREEVAVLSGRGARLVGRERRRSGGGSPVAFNFNAGAKAGSVSASRDVAPTLKTEHNPAVSFAVRTGQTGSNGDGVSAEMSHTIDTSSAEAVLCCGVDCLTPWEVQSQRLYSSRGPWPSLRSNSGGGMDRQAVVYDVSQITSRDNRSNPAAGDPCSTIAAGSDLVCVSGDAANAAVDGDLCGTVKCGGGVPNRRALRCGSDLAGTLTARDCKGICDRDAVDGKVIVQCARSRS